MTCRGYDPKAVKIHKSIKRLAATVKDKHQRGMFIRDYVRIAESNLRTNNKKEK